MAKLEVAISSHRIIGLDTSIFIYHLEAHPRYEPLTSRVLAGIEKGERRAVVSVVALMELTVHPWRQEKPAVARQYEAVLCHFPNLEMIDVNREVARRAAQIRAAFGVRPADALHVATALVGGATAYVTNDRALTRLKPLLAILLLDDIVV